MRCHSPRRTWAYAGALFATLLWTTPASALPVLHTINGSLSGLTADVTATMDVLVNRASGATDNGTANVVGALSSTPNGTIQVDWGDPGWSGSLDVAAGDVVVNAPSPGSANGSLNINLFGLLPVSFDLDVNVDAITLGLSTSFSAPTNPSPPGSGPWTGTDTVDVLLGAQLDVLASGPFGISLAENDLVIGPSVVPGIDVEGTLSRLGGDPGTGSRIELPLSGLSIALPPGDPTNIMTPGCELGGPFGSCLLDVASVDVTISSLVLSNIQGTLVADSSTAITVPEPAIIALGTLALLSLAVIRRR